MAGVIKVVTAWAGIAALAVLLCLPGSGVHAQDDAAGKDEAKSEEAAAPKDGDKADDAEKDKAEEPAAKDESEDVAEAAGLAAKGGLKMKDLLAEGFLIRTTVLVPAEVVTRQLGKVSPDAIVVTLQKEAAIAVCYYTLKAYVRPRLVEIPTCTAFR